MKTLERVIVGLLSTFVLLVTAVAVTGTAQAWRLHDRPLPFSDVRVPHGGDAVLPPADSSAGSTLAVVLIVAIWIGWCVLLLGAVGGGRYLVRKLAR
ncbi:hypothetical protein ACXJJ3_40995 [Kribbella sp. WER1]